MRKNIVILCLLLLAGSKVIAQGILFEQGSWKEALQKAKQENKILFVDFYTSWCAPCKMVAKTVFPQEKFGNYYNQYFINYQLDGEKGEGPEIVKKYGIKVYPTFLYLDGNGQVIYSFSGAKDVKGFLEEAEKVAVCAKFGGWKKMQTEDKAGNGDPDFLWAYYGLVDKNEKPRVLNRYLKALPDDKLFTVEVGKMLERELSLYDYALFKRMVEGRVKLGEQSVDFDFYFTFGLQRLLTHYLDEGIDTGNEKLFREALELRKLFSPLPGTQDRDVDMVWGRGAFFASEDFLQLRYLWVNGNQDERFRESLESYLAELLQDNPLDTLDAARYQVEKEMKGNALIKKVLRGNLKSRHKLMASYIINFTDYYWRLMPSDKATRERCAVWVNYACNMNPYCAEIPIQAASLLIRIKHQKDAVRHLENAIEKQKMLYEDTGVSASGELQDHTKLFRNLQNKLRDVKNGKE